VLVSILGLVLVREPYYNEAGYDVLVGLEQSIVPSAQYSERIYFQSRLFIEHALQIMPGPFGEVLSWLYLDKSDQSPDLMTKAINALKDIVEDDGKGNVVRGGLKNPVSKGALVIFKRHLAMLETLKKN
jgi:ubiquitin-conjugating enzyme E2 O